jgi:sorting nexin-13
VRAALNAVFGEVAAAARRVDARRLLLGDAAELVIDAIALFRDARDGAVASLAGGAAEYASLPAAAREALLVAELDAAGNLHPALRAPAPTPGGRTGHYAVLRRVAEGVCAAALDRRDFDNPVLRPVARELLTSAVLRPLVGLFAPHSARRLLLAALARAGAVDAATLPPGVLPPPPAHSWDFDERARSSAAAEDAQAAARAAAAAGARAAASAAAAPSGLRHAASDATALLRARRPDGGASFSVPPSPEGRLGGGLGGRPPPPWASAGRPRGGGHRRTLSATTGPPPLSSRALFTETLPPDDDSDGGSSRVSGSTAPTPGRRRDRDRPPSPPPLGEGHLLPTGGVPLSGPGGAAYFGAFLGRPRARVVGAECDTTGPKDVVLFHLRVADGRGEWAVTRRHRHFEALHRALKDVPGYRLRLPSRRAFGPTQTPDAVEERRRALDAHLWRLLADPALAGRTEVWDFLSAWGAPPPLAPGFLRSAASSLRGAGTAVGRGVVGSVVAVADAVGGAGAAVGGAARSAARGADRGLSRKRTPARSVGGRPPPLDVAGSPPAGGREASPPPRAVAAPAPPPTTSTLARPTPRASQATTPNQSPSSTPPRGERGESAPRAASPPASRGASPPPAGARAPAATPAPTPPRPPAPDDDGAASSSGSASRGASAAAERERERAPRSRLGASVPPVGVSIDDEPDPMASPTSARSMGRSASSPAVADEGRTAGFAPARSAPAAAADGAASDASSGSPDRPPPPDTGHIDPGRVLADAPRPDPSALEVAPAQPPPRSPAGGPPGSSPQDEDWEQVAGASAPLYELVGVLFELNARGFFRRQVFSVARQALSLVAGGAVDDWLLRKVRGVASESAAAGALLRLQASLWPGGTWYARAPAAAAAAAGAQPPPKPPIGLDGRPAWRPLAEAAFLQPLPAALAHADEIEAALRAALLAGPTPALARVVGRDAYKAGVADALDMLASPSAMLGLGHALLKTVVLSLYPRLKPLYAEVEAAR